MLPAVRSRLHTCARAAVRRHFGASARARADDSVPLPPAPVAAGAVPGTRGAVLTAAARAVPLLQFPYLVVQRQLEIMQLLVGLEEARRRGGGSILQ
jgi:hypothetical protein